MCTGWLQRSVAGYACRQSRQQMSKLGAGRRAHGSGTLSNRAGPVGHLSLTEIIVTREAGKPKTFLFLP